MRKAEKEKLGERINRLQEKIERLEKEENNSRKTSNSKLSRREFLKKAGAGAAGIGALALTPSTANLELTQNGIFQNGTDVTSGLQKALIEGKALVDDGNTYSSVQTAVDNASSWVKIGPGTFNESVTVPTSDLTIEGIGQGTVIDGGTSGPGIDIGSSTSNIDIRSLKIKRSSLSPDTNGYWIRSQGSGTTISHVETEGRGSGSGNHVALRMLGAEPSIENCRILNHNGYVCQLDGNSSRIVNCHVETAELTTSDHSRCIFLSGDDGIAAQNLMTSSINDGIGLQIHGNDCIGIGNRCMGNGSPDSGIVTTGTNCIAANNRVSGYSNNTRDNGSGNTFDGNLTGAAN